MSMTTCWRHGVLLAGLICATAASAQYKSIGPDGRVTYSDLPPPAPSRIVDQKKRGTDATAAPVLPFELQQAATRYPVTLYTGDKCGPCDDARAYLRGRGVPFTERTVTSDEDIALFKQQSPDGTAPVVTIGSRRYVGFSQVVWSGLLDNAGYPAASALPRDWQNATATPLSPNTRAAAQSVTPPPSPATARRETAASGETPAAPGPAGFRF